MEKIEICKMTLSDFYDIKDCLLSDFDNFWKPEVLQTEIDGENKYYIVAKINNKIVGFAGILFNYEDVEIMNIVTKKSERKKGIGTVLFDKIIEICNEKNIKNIFLEVNEKNLPAINLYTKFGFEIIGRRKKYYNSIDDAILMSKKINIL